MASGTLGDNPAACAPRDRCGVGRHGCRPHLCLRVRFQGEQTVPENLRLYWLSGLGAAKDFDLMYVAGLRSVGIGARLNRNDAVGEKRNHR